MKTKLILIATLLVAPFISSAQTHSESSDVVLTNLGKSVNSSWSDFCPVINADASVLIFTSRRPATKNEMKADTNALERIYISKFNKSTNSFSDAELMGPEVNEPGRNNSAIALSNDGQSLLIYRDDDQGNGDIWESRLVGDKWSKAKKLPAPINSPYHESTACYAPDGKAMYFVSQRSEGKGGRDIWTARRDNEGKWSMATNLESLNTKSDEEGVYIHPDGVTMYFSSKAHGSQGGYDLFISKLNNGNWSAPISMGAPFNTSSNDVFLVLDASATKGYYTSANSGGFGMEDLYLVSFVKRKEEPGPRLTLLKGKVYDEKIRRDMWRSRRIFR